MTEVIYGVVAAGPNYPRVEAYYTVYSLDTQYGMIQELQGIRVLFCEGNGNLYEADAGGEELLDLWTEVQSELPPTKETLQQLYVPGL